jgi:hypothetical protein
LIRLSNYVFIFCWIFILICSLDNFLLDDLKKLLKKFLDFASLKISYL